jgi:hypothetical protein
VVWVPHMMLKLRAHLAGPPASLGFNMWASLPQ